MNLLEHMTPKQNILLVGQLFVALAGDLAGLVLVKRSDEMFIFCMDKPQCNHRCSIQLLQGFNNVGTL